MPSHALLPTLPLGVHSYNAVAARYSTGSSVDEKSDQIFSNKDIEMMNPLLTKFGKMSKLS